MDIEPGTLYLCATPIGNLEDITERVRETLGQVDLIAAEDTRNSMKLLTRFDIHVPMTSYHKFNQYDKAEELIGRLKEGKSIALISDAGTPGISDPGEVLVKRCVEEGVKVSALPGASAAITALILSGLPGGRFAFEGFLPREGKDRKTRIKELENEKRTIIIYEAPHRLRKTLKELFEVLGDRKIALCRELTKKHEEVLRMGLGAALDLYSEKEPKGEYVLVVEGYSGPAGDTADSAGMGLLTIAELMQHYMDKGLSKKEAMRAVALDRGVSRRDIYRELLEKDG
ncbi:MAG: 16S rRNA (cytidine(1402)-2'-O)-methyltransferase [Lachnospiraceae bacterium]|nr:16S rRNA (cytidine(1402)-2'-O)-methyltransferase [Lachnospiraceae bacterium]